MEPEHSHWATPTPEKSETADSGSPERQRRDFTQPLGGNITRSLAGVLSASLCWVQHIDGWGSRFTRQACLLSCTNQRSEMKSVYTRFQGRKYLCANIISTRLRRDQVNSCRARQIYCCLSYALLYCPLARCKVSLYIRVYTWSQTRSEGSRAIPGKWWPVFRFVHVFWKTFRVAGIMALFYELLWFVRKTPAGRKFTTPLKLLLVHGCLFSEPVPILFTAIQY